MPNLSFTSFITADDHSLTFSQASFLWSTGSGRMHSLSATFVPSYVPSLGRPHAAISRRTTRSPWRQPHYRNRLRVILRANGNASQPDGTGAQRDPQSVGRDADTQESSTNAYRAPRISKTLFGRVIVEILSLCMGAVLLLIILFWRFSQFVALQAVRLFTWLSGIRHLGKVAFSRLTRVRSIAIPSPSISHAVRRLLSRSRGNGALDPDPIPIVDVQHQQVPSVKDSFVGANTTNSSNTHTRTYPSSPKTYASTHGRRLILLRHAKTHWDRDGDTPDHERSLSARGCDEARLVGDELVRIEWIPDLILCSDATRTMQTLQLLQVPQSPQVKTTWTDSLYYAVTADEMAQAVDEALDNFPPKTTLLVVAHNPGCEELVEFLTGERAEMGTACAALLESKVPKNARGSRARSAPHADELFSMTADNSQWSLVELIRPSTLFSTRPWRKN